MGLTYEDHRAIVQRAERAGFEAFFRSDHYASFPGGAGLPTTDAWATLAGLARETTRINLGVLVSPVTFRAPGNLAKVSATVAEMSGGRVEVGLGAGWNELEHNQQGLAFPGTRVRFDMLEEQLAEAWSSDVLHDDERRAVMFAVVEHADAVAMREARASEGLHPKPSLDVRISG